MNINSSIDNDDDDHDDVDSIWILYIFSVDGKCCCFGDFYDKGEYKNYETF